jgi:hypothetical protein
MLDPNIFETITYELQTHEVMEAYGHGLYMRRKTTTENWDGDHYLYASVRSRRRRIVLEQKRKKKKKKKGAFVSPPHAKKG